MRIGLAQAVVLAGTLMLFLPTLGYGLVYEDLRDFGASVDVHRTLVRIGEQHIQIGRAHV